MKKPETRNGSQDRDDLRAEYSFDYSRARPNPYAGDLEGRAVAVVLDPDVASAFESSEAVNAALRAMVTATPRKR